MKTYGCELCGKRFLDSLRLRMHLLAHSGRQGRPTAPLSTRSPPPQGVASSLPAGALGAPSRCAEPKVRPDGATSLPKQAAVSLAKQLWN